MQIKAGTSYAGEMTKGLKRFRDLQNLLHGAALIYGGDEARTVDGIQLVSFHDTAAVLFS